MVGLHFVLKRNKKEFQPSDYLPVHTSCVGRQATRRVEVLILLNFIHTVTAVHRQSDDSVRVRFVTLSLAAAVSKDNPRLKKQAMGSSQNSVRTTEYRMQLQYVVKWDRKVSEDKKYLYPKYKCAVCKEVLPYIQRAGFKCEMLSSDGKNLIGAPIAANEGPLLHGELGDLD
ncbi:hypothetical protein N656DRAFT_26663 [Canariomyces notabilis]|uniref:Uncharacterized protein n=1 Tax=Canariomyces notabilis TaxID=2074819 RepID=A0AAN6TMR9_9PEZI|nr:hypothetical protein N656DRAFT_26663 [Canariomyces arenarius]